MLTKKSRFYGSFLFTATISFDKFLQGAG